MIAKVSGLPSAPKGTFAAQGLLDGAPVHVDVSVDRNQAGAIQALIRRAEWKSAHAEGDITVAAAAAQTHGQLQLQMGQLTDLQGLLGMNVGGSLTGSIMLHPEQGQTHAQLHLDARDLSVEQLKGNAQLSAEGSTDALGFKLALQLPNLRGSKASLSANGSVNLDTRKVALAAADANYRGQDVRLLSPAQIALADGVAVDVLKLGVQSAVLQIRGEISPALDLRASLQQVQPALINAFAPGLLASGTIEGRARLKGTLASPTENSAGMIAKYFATSLAIEKVVSEPRVIRSCLPISTISMSLVGFESRSTMLPASFAAVVPVFMATPTSA